MPRWLAAAAHRRLVPAGAERARRHERVSLALDPGGRAALLAGVSADRRPVLVRIEERGPRGRGDRFRLWIAGVEVTGDGSLRQGDVVVRAP